MMLDQLQYAVAGIGSLAMLPLAAAIVGGIRAQRKEHRRQAMLDRFYKNLY
jgi:hypothetical protein